MKSYITSIGTANPPNTTLQKDVAEFMVTALQASDRDARKIRALYRWSGIESRSSALTDYNKLPQDYEFYSTELDDSFPGTSARMDVYKVEAPKLAFQAIDECFAKTSTSISEVTHLITVSCTGMYAPGIDIDIIKKYKLDYAIQRTAINFMGCYAAVNAIKAADAIIKSDPGSVVLVLALELCTLHLQKSLTDDDLLSGAIFADGAAAWLTESKPNGTINLSPENFHCALFPEGEQDMAWDIGNFGFEMRLSSYVPKLVEKGIEPLTKKLKENLQKQNVDYYAVHPGGKKILEAAEKALDLSKEDLHSSYKVLSRHGNMSSPTIVFVLKELINSFSENDAGKHVMALAFGPGLALESALFKVVVK